MKFKKYYLFIVFFFVILLIPVLFINRKHDVKSPIDNRVLIEFPKIGETNFFVNFEKALNDRIGFRSEIITAYIFLNDILFHAMEHPAYTYGKKGYVFFKMHKNVEYNDYHETFVQAVKKMNDYCEDRGIKFYFFFNPEKISTYRRYLPSGVTYEDEWVDKLIVNLEQLGVCCVNNKQYLLEKSYTENVFNKKYDAGHWNDLGMFYGINQLFKTIHNDFMSVNELSFDDFLITEKIEHSLPVSKFPIKETVPSFQTKVHFENKTPMYNEGLNFNPSFRSFHYFEREDDENLPKILMFQGSYMNRNWNYIINNASVDVAVHNYQNVLDMDYYVNIFQPDIVVFEVAEYCFSDSYFDKSKMNSINFAPALKIDDFNTENISPCATRVSLTDVYTNLFINVPQKDVQYVWLMLGEKSYDLKKESNNIYTVMLPKEFVEGNVSLFVQYGDNKKVKMPISTIDIKEDNIINEIYRTQNVLDNSDGYITYTTTTEGNRFDYVGVQIHNPRNNTYFYIHNTSAVETNKGVFFNEEETGEYVINLRGNSNLVDEFISYNVWLEHDKIYTWEYTVDSFSSESITIHDFSFK